MGGGSLINVSALTKINLKPLNPESLLMCSLWMHTWMSVGFHVKLLKVRSIRLEKCWKNPIPAHCALICICRETQASIWLLSICDHHTPRGLERESKREGEGIVLVTARQFALTTMWRWGLLRFDRLPYSPCTHADITRVCVCCRKGIINWTTWF